MTVYHLIDALPAAFFGLLGIWAAVVRRHWFLRFAVVCVFLLVCLLIPAYEVVIEFGIAIALIMTGVWISHGFQRERFRFSLESALLAMVVVAIGSAVIGKAPELGWADWLNLFSIGGAIAIVSLLCLWLVFGKTSLWRRLLLGLLGFLVFTALYYFSSATQYLLMNPEWSFAWLERLWERATDTDVLSWGVGYCIPTSLLGFTILCSVLALARGSRWFAVADDQLLQPTNKRTLAARFGLVALMLCLFSPLCYLFYRLMTPTPYPVVEMPAENGWDDFVAAGGIVEEANIDLTGLVQATKNGTEAEAQFAIDAIRSALDRIDLGLSRSQFQIGRYYDSHQVEKKFSLIDPAYSVLIAKFFYAERFEPPGSQIITMTKSLQFSDFFNKDIGFDRWIDVNIENHTRALLQPAAASFDASQCKQIVAFLHEYDSQRGSLENRLNYQRLADENSGWLKYIQLLLQEWSGEDPYAWESQRYLNNVRYTRILITQFALQRYFLEHNQLPETLAELVPLYLPAIPVDPHTIKTLHYQRLWGGYTLSTLDEDVEDRVIVTGPAALYLWQRLQESWQGFRATFRNLQKD